jgi:hypothetical protein
VAPTLRDALEVMTITESLAPRNSLLLIMDRDAAGIPESMAGKSVVATASCVAVGTRHEADGKTSVTLTDETEVGSDCQQKRLRRIFSIVLDTPKREVMVCTALLQTVAKLPVAGVRTRIEVFTNHESEPDHIRVVAHPQVF